MRFAPDGFRGRDGIWGGDLVDQATPFAGRDKTQHLVLGTLVGLLLRRWAHLGVLRGLELVLVLAILWELVEWWRYARWIQRGRPAPWPFAADLPSWRDVVAGVAGAGLAWLLL